MTKSFLIAMRTMSVLVRNACQVIDVIDVDEHGKTSLRRETIVIIYMHILSTSY